MKTYTRKQIMEKLGISKQTLWMWGKTERFVLPDPVGLRRYPYQYDADEIDRLINAIDNFI